MSRATFYTACSLDGFLATKDDSLDWLFRQRIDEDGPMNHGAFMAGVGALVMGATTYAWVVDHGERTGEPWAYTVPTWVVAHRQFPPTENDVRFVSGDVESWWPGVVDSAGDREIWVVGGGDLAGQIADAGHLDRMLVQYAPVTLGSGRPLLPRVQDFALVDVVRNQDFVCAEFAVVR